MQQPDTMSFPIDGVYLADDRQNICNRYMCTIRLKNLNIKTSGSYSCEISGDAPEFKLIHDISNMTVAGLYT